MNKKLNKLTGHKKALNTSHCRIPNHYVMLSIKYKIYDHILDRTWSI